MRIIHMMRERDDLQEYKSALKKTKEALAEAKEGFDTICDLSEDMEDEYSERGGYSDRYGSRGYSDRRGYSRRDDHDWDGMDERRYRDSMGRYR